jgi:hypothetical protein
VVEQKEELMSILATLKLDVEKFAKATESDLEKFAAEFQRLFAKAPSALQAIDNFVTEAAGPINIAVGLADPAAEPLVAGALSTVETGLAALSASAQAATSGTSLLTNLQNFSTTVPTLLTGITVKNPALQTEITNIVNLVTGECKVLLPAVESWVAQIKAAATPETASGATA